MNEVSEPENGGYLEKDPQQNIIFLAHQHCPNLAKEKEAEPLNINITVQRRNSHLLRKSYNMNHIY